MKTHPLDLTIKIRSADGTSTEYYQTDEARIHEALRLLADPRPVPPGIQLHGFGRE